MSKIRLWQLGKIDGDDPSHWIIPSKAAIAKLSKLLRDKLNGDIMDLVWGPDLKCTIIDEATDEVLVPIQQDDGTFLYKLEDV